MRFFRMAAHDDVLAVAIATLQHAPLVPLTAEEEALLAEVEPSPPVQWLSHEEVVANLGARCR